MEDITFPNKIPKSQLFFQLLGLFSFLNLRLYILIMWFYHKVMKFMERFLPILISCLPTSLRKRFIHRDVFSANSRKNCNMSRQFSPRSHGASRSLRERNARLQIFPKVPRNGFYLSHPAKICCRGNCLLCR